MIRITKQKTAKKLVVALVIVMGVLLFTGGLPVAATDYTSDSFILRDPVVTVAGGRSTSTDFEYFSSLGQTVTGESTITSFSLKSGFLYFSVVTAPTLTATAGTTQVALTWTAASVALGSTVDTYEVGQSTTSGGSYTFTDVGNVLASTRTGLTAGTPYYFVVRALDASDNVMVTSTEASATPTAAASTSSGSSGGGGGGGSVYVPPPPAITQVTFSGRAYPLSKVTVLKDGQLAVSTIAGPDARFEVSETGLSTGTYIFSVYGEDKKGIRSTVFTFPVFITTGGSTKVSGIFIAPTLGLDKSEVKRGDNIIIFGHSPPQAEVTIAVHSDPEFFAKATADKDGAYLNKFDTAPLSVGSHLAKSKAAVEGEISTFGTAVSFAVGDKNVAVIPEQKVLKGDLNGDGRVNLVDFSIAAFWYKRPLSTAFQKTEKERLNGDGKIDLTDFSIMAFYWTG